MSRFTVELDGRYSFAPLAFDLTMPWPRRRSMAVAMWLVVMSQMRVPAPTTAIMRSIRASRRAPPFSVVPRSAHQRPAASSSVI
ncbi:hypothetical protein EQG53_02505 [Brevundimonas diminuta]|uniref:Uncharacterized protein n=1 Tax=Brevundimonas diminuta TaxID=293 RepID=A0A410NTK0_BREDI|nr:hypothetical protein EQG53_02505 [Brevundimonas diminuta]